jgi:hypothetical protein
VVEFRGKNCQKIVLVTLLEILYNTIMNTAKKKSKRNALNVNQKIEIIKAISDGEKHDVVAQRFGLPRTTVTSIFGDKERIMQELEKGNAGDRKKMRCVKHPEVETALATWFRQKRSLGVPVNGNMLQEKAKHFAEQCGVASTFKDIATEQILTDAEIVADVIGNKPEEVAFGSAADSDSDKDTGLPGHATVTYSDSHKAMQTLKTFLEKRSEVQVFNLVHQLEEALLDLHFSNLKQQVITDYFQLEPTSNVPSASTQPTELAATPLCAVCGKEYFGDHFCKVCSRSVHVFCGLSEPDEEGYGLPVTCFNCAP